VLRGRGWIVAVVAPVVFVATACSSNGKHSSPPVQSKLVPAAQIRRLNAVVTPDNAAVQAALDASPLVQSYAHCPGNVSGFAVQSAPIDKDIGTSLATALGATGHVEDKKGPPADVRVVFKPDATVANVDAVRVALSRDPLDVSGYNFRQSARPQTFDFNVRKAEILPELKRRFESFAGVKNVVVYPSTSAAGCSTQP
jgi:hypothetical protein